MQLEEIYILSKYNIPPSYSTKLPVYKRRQFLNIIHEDNENQRKQIEKEHNKNKKRR